MVFSASTLAFAGFAVLLAMRDILSELFLQEDPISLAFLNCAVIATLAGTILLFTGQFGLLIQKLKKKTVGFRALILGITASIVYGVTFYMLQVIGAGLFDLIDYGLAPLLTAGIGVIYFRDKIRPEFIVSFVLYLIGIVLLKISKPMFGWELIAVAIASPIATAASDGLTKWLLSEEGGNLTRAELLFVRFVPASILLCLMSVLFSPQGLYVNDLEKALPVAAIFGFCPLWLLCTGLGRKGLTELAMWEFIIPGIAFFGTLPAHWEAHGKWMPILGACLVIGALVAGESKSVSNLFSKRKVS